ncbi:MAG: Bax inhibitor-1/YccA family protein [Hyphomicrobiaceae bacterium]
MAQIDRRYRTSAGPVAQEAGYVDQGLRSHMLGIYNYMAAGVAVTGLIAYAIFAMLSTSDPSQAVATLRNGVMLTEAGKAVFGSPLMYVVAFAPLAYIFLIGFRAHKMSVSGAQLTFWTFAAVMGASLSTIFLRYTGASIVQMFFITAAAFAVLSLWGYTTKKDLSGWGSFLIMGVVGLILATIVNIFLQSSALQFAISALGVLAFAGLTAYDTQRLKDEYYMLAGDATAVAKSAIFGALSLYLDFVNMFTSLLSLFGGRE